MRTTTASTGYTGASGSYNVFLTNTAGRYFEIAGINTQLYTGLELSFGVFKSTIAENGSGLSVEFSTDGTNWTAMTIPAFPTGSGTAVWSYKTATGPTIPSVANLRIRFTNLSTTNQWRIDDVLLTGSPTAIDLESFEAVANADGSVSVQWVTAAEWDHAGFNVYRSSSAAAAGVQVNPALIAAQGLQGQGASYELTDSAVTAGVWYYTLEDVDIHGNTTQHGPVSVTVGEPLAVGLAGAGAATVTAWLPLLLVLAALAGTAVVVIGRNRAN
jgi:hypothetical protein